MYLYLNSSFHNYGYILFSDQEVFAKGESHQRRVCELLPARGGSEASQQGRLGDCLWHDFVTEFTLSDNNEILHFAQNDTSEGFLRMIVHVYPT